jgi:hypothetical protein
MRKYRKDERSLDHLTVSTTDVLLTHLRRSRIDPPLAVHVIQEQDVRGLADEGEQACQRLSP